MQTNRFISRMVMVASLAAIAGLPTVSLQAADRPTGQDLAPSASVLDRNTLAAGSVEDSLKACMGRIPKDASAGQRMVAEQSCERDEANRKSFQAVPGR
jgi:hypothetical protein